MIVYTGKQYWNDFNNWDEALFQDANRPRDNDKFKIRPWLQSDKWKQREVNKDITTVASQLVATWTTNNVAASSSIPNTATISALSEVENEKTGNPWCIVNKDWNIEITEDGTYIIQAITQFVPPSIPANWYNYVEAVWLLKHKTWNYTWSEREELVHNEVRLCGQWDIVTARWVGMFKKWTVLNVWAIHSYWTAMTLNQKMNIQRLA